jgi:acyl-CoA thioester hydrolase
MQNEATYRGVVYPWQCDHNGHMNITFYVEKFDEANWSLLARVGLLTPTYSRETGRGIVALQENLTYKREVMAGDLLEIRSRLIEVREKVARFTHEMRITETGELAASCEMTTVHIDRHTRKSIPFPPAIREAALKHVESTT